MCKKHFPLSYFLIILIALSISLCGCSKGSKETKVTSTTVTGVRDNEPIVLVPSLEGSDTIGNDSITLILSSTSQGYIVASYRGNSEKVKLQLSNDPTVTYTYNLTIGGDDVIPLSQGDGTYNATVFESIGQDQYSILFTDSFKVSIDNQFGPFLYPNQYVNFNNSSSVVSLGKELAEGATSDLEVVANVYNYVISNITYDHDEAATVESGYLPDVDEVLSTKKGICFDYAALMSAILRTQRIPTRLEIGYCSDAYHAWISVYTADTGWVNGFIEFDGTNWQLMDPTFAANSSDKKMEKLIGDGSRYITKYMY